MRAAPRDLLAWALAEAGPPPSTEPVLLAVAGDASPRRYFRLSLPRRSLIVVHAPPATEKNQAFIDAAGLFTEAGLHVPEVYACDLQRGYLLLEDLGSRLLLDQLGPGDEAPYAVAMELLLELARYDVSQLDWPRYDRALLEDELQRFPEWFAAGLLDQPLSAQDSAVFTAFCEVLIESALAQPQVLVHRDFHSRNLMPQADGGLGVIDFQDAVIGPLSYDLVSLLRDCYIQWPAEQVGEWALAQRRRLLAAGLAAGDDDAQFLRWFDLMGLQRHIKVLGTFARLYLRDGKAGYLDDLPLVLRYVREVLAARAPEEPALARFRDWFEARMVPAAARQPWGAQR
jgi:aminoglycoside/choline kinase family phosphotransferase